MLELTLNYYYVELTMVGLDLRVHTNVHTYVVLKYTVPVNQYLTSRVVPVCILLQHQYSKRTVIYYTSSIFNAATIIYYT